MVLNAGSLGRRIQIQRYTKIGRNEFGNSVGEWGQFGPAIFAQRRDVSDEERLLAGRWDNVLVTRFIIRATSFGRSITRYDRLEHDGITFEIEGIKEVPSDRAFLEITAKSDAVP